MELPFTQAEFFRVVAEYNLAVWPAQPALAVLALVATVLTFRSTRWADRAVTSILALLWLWMGVAYHWAFFTGINRAAWLFGALFVLQGASFLYLALRAEPLRYRPRWDGFGLMGAAFLAYGLVLYPMIGAALGHGWPDQPTFGLPCPTTIFTLGILLWARPRVPPALLAIPVAWSLVGTSAAWLLGVEEDYALAVAGILGGVLILARNRRPSPPARESGPGGRPTP